MTKQKTRTKINKMKDLSYSQFSSSNLEQKTRLANRFNMDVDTLRTKLKNREKRTKTNLSRNTSTNTMILN